MTQQRIFTHGGSTSQRIVRLLRELRDLEDNASIRIIGGQGDNCDLAGTVLRPDCKFIGIFINDSHHGFDLEEAKVVLDAMIQGMQMFTNAGLPVPSPAPDLVLAIKTAIDAVESGKIYPTTIYHPETSGKAN